MKYTSERKFKARSKILDRKHSGGIAIKDQMAFLNNGSPSLRKCLRADNRNKAKNAKMNSISKAVKMNQGYEFIQNFIKRAV